MASATHRRRSFARGLVRIEVQAAMGTLDLSGRLRKHFVATRPGPKHFVPRWSKRSSILRSKPPSISSVPISQKRLSRAYSTSRDKRNGERRTFEVPARYERHIRNPQAPRTDPNVAKWVAQTPVKEIGTSVLVLAEIRRGIELKRRRDAEQAAALDRWFAQMRTRLGDRVLPIDEPIAEAWALLSVPDPCRSSTDCLPRRPKCMD